MSDLVPTSDEELALIQQLGGVGLEDIDQADLIMPRLGVKHQRQMFFNPQTNEEFEELDVILLGMLKQRALWPATYGGDTEPPICRSYDADEGHPRTDIFPWEESGFSPPPNADDRPVLDCESCYLKDFGTHPVNTKAPWCQEQHVYPLLVLGEDGQSMTPMIYTVAKTGLKPSRNYMSYFYTNKRPSLTVITRLSLDAARKGSNEYSIPRFERLGASDSSKWLYWGEQFTNIKAMLNTPLVRSDDEQPVAAPARAPRKAAGRPASQPADGDLWADEGDTPEG